MRKLMFVTFVLVQLGVTTQLRGQADVASDHDGHASPPGESSLEEAPPPVPSPTPDDAVPRPTAKVEADGSVLAYDFGVSLLPADSGVRVRGVVVGSVAESIGVRPNELIVTVNGEPAADGATLQSENVQSVGVLRGGQVTILSTSSNAAQMRTPADNGDVENRDGNPARNNVSRSYDRRTYRYAPSYGYRGSPGYRYVAPYPYYGRSYYPVYRSPGVSIGIGVGGGRYGPVYGRGGYGRGRGYYYNRRGGVGISVGGIGIRF